MPDVTLTFGAPPRIINDELPALELREDGIFINDSCKEAFSLQDEERYLIPVFKFTTKLTAFLIAVKLTDLLKSKQLNSDCLALYYYPKNSVCKAVSIQKGPLNVSPITSSEFWNMLNSILSPEKVDILYLYYAYKVPSSLLLDPIIGSTDDIYEVSGKKRKEQSVVTENTEFVHYPPPESVYKKTLTQAKIAVNSRLMKVVKPEAASENPASSYPDSFYYTLNGMDDFDKFIKTINK